MAYRVTLIPGDGIGPEVVAAGVRVLTATGIEFEWDTQPAGATAIGEHGSALPERTLESVRRNKVALKGPTETPIGTGHRSVNVELRKTLDLYANLRPVKTLPGVKSRYDGVDLVVVRENTEDLYSGLEHVVVPGVVESLKIITEKASTRIARFAFDYATANGRRRITAVHKANIMKLSDGLFLDCCRAVAKEFPARQVRRDDRGQHLHAARARPHAVRHPAAGEPLRRHRLRPLRRLHRRPGHGARGQHRAGHRALRGRARQRPRHRREEPGQPDRGGPLRAR